MLDLAIAVPTLVGSVLSMIAAGTILLCYLILPAQKHFRHTLILNLAAADFLNALSNTTSGIIKFARGSLKSGAACNFNGFLGQLTVQATDFSILFISVATVITIRRYNYEPKMRPITKFLITIGIWLVPISTSLTALALNAYQPVSGNWCWISPSRTDLRYALTHGWRMAIIFITIGLYIYLFLHIHQHFSSQRQIAKLIEDTRSLLDRRPSDGSTESDARLKQEIYIFNEFEIYTEPLDSYWSAETHVESYATFVSPAGTDLKQGGTEQRPIRQDPLREIKQTLHPHITEVTDEKSSPQPSRPQKRHEANARTPLLTHDPLALIRRSQPPQPQTHTARAEAHPVYLTISVINARERLVQKLLFLNSYPIGYLVLWAPGLANRLAELNGHHSRVLAIMQASTQYVGLANALVYGYNENILSRLFLWWTHEGRHIKRTITTHTRSKLSAIFHAPTTTIPMFHSVVHQIRVLSAATATFVSTVATSLYPTDTVTSTSTQTTTPTQTLVLSTTAAQANRTTQTKKPPSPPVTAARKIVLSTSQPILHSNPPLEH